MKYFIFPLFLALLLTLIIDSPLQAGEPDNTVGPINPNLYVCATFDHRIIPVGSDAFSGRSGSNADFNFFDETVKVDLDKLKHDCNEVKKDNKDLDPHVELLQQTRIEGVVYEFHPEPDVLPSGNRGWIGVPSRDVLVVATGINFEIFWGSEKDGSYFFNYLGAGPITLNLRLPPDAHPLNPNISLMSTSFFETWRIPLAFYRGEIEPGEDDIFSLPTGEQLPPANTFFEELGPSGPVSGMPNVGGILPQAESTSVIILAVMILVILPAAGILKIRHDRAES